LPAENRLALEFCRIGALPALLCFNLRPLRHTETGIAAPQPIKQVAGRR